MTGDNIVRPAFGKKKSEADGSKVQSAPPHPDAEEVSDDYKHIGPLTGEELLRAQKDLVYILANHDFVHAMRNKLGEAGDTIFSLRGYSPDKESIRLRRQGLKSYSLEEICREVEKTHQLQWRKQPSYLGALTLEHHYRVQVALSLMNEEENSKDPSPD